MNYQNNYFNHNFLKDQGAANQINKAFVSHRNNQFISPKANRNIIYDNILNKTGDRFYINRNEMMKKGKIIKIPNNALTLEKNNSKDNIYSRNSNALKGTSPVKTAPLFYYNNNQALNSPQRQRYINYINNIKKSSEFFDEDYERNRPNYYEYKPSPLKNKNIATKKVVVKKNLVIKKN